MTVAEVVLWGRTIAALNWNQQQGLAYFEYTPSFVSSGIEVSPLSMPLSSKIYSFPILPRDTFRGLPGLVTDSLPDDFGNALIDAWLAREGRLPGSFNPVERLCYTGNRGMGALEYLPSCAPEASPTQSLNVAALVQLAGDILSKRNHIKGSLSAEHCKDSLQDILRVGTSAGGARAKAIIAWNPVTNEVRSGQVPSEEGFSYWLLKFDGVSGNKDRELDDPIGYGLIEYAYYKMALEAGIEISECRLLREGGRSHFMTKRFDRNEKGHKTHMQSMGALAHWDYRQPGAYGYEQVLQTIRRLGMPISRVEEQFRRMAFNIIARNQDDHVKNIAFIMDPSGTWDLSPAFDVTYSYNPDGDWTNQHQMTLGGKRDHFLIEDFKVCARLLSMGRNRPAEIIEQVHSAVKHWRLHAEAAGVPEDISRKISKTHRTNLIT